METNNFQINLRKKKHCHYKLPLPLSDTIGLWYYQIFFQKLMLITEFTELMSVLCFLNCD